ncbi:MAG TPA: formylglycine-generating enzyme family protein [Blastocatellia bacterium]|nr:formylglycine-generating enzyme family protein [Blastocatellia bacterium]
MKKQSPNKGKSGVVAIFALAFLLLSFCLPAVLESSIAMSRQVGVDARTPKKKPSNESKETGKTGKKSGPSKTQPPMGTLILKTDMDCRIAIDNESTNELDENKLRELKVKPGQHVVQAKSRDGLYSWTQTVQVEAFKRMTVSVELKKKKAEAEEAARIEEEKKKEAAKAEEEKKKAAAKAEEEKKKTEAVKNPEETLSPEALEKKRALDSLMDLANYARIPAGSFLMGSTTGNADEKPPHRVRISRPFEMGKYEVTQAQWVVVMGNNPSNFKGPNLPVENVSWEAVQLFIQKLNDQTDKYIYRLPTEAEWEYACRAGSTGDYAGALDSMGWYGDNSGAQRLNASEVWKADNAGYLNKLTSNKAQTHPVGLKQANAWGLHDMYGNVWEWCQDLYAETYYGKSLESDPQGPGSGDFRVRRGGSWYNFATSCRSSQRDKFRPDAFFSNIGFRLVRTPR